MRFPDSLYHTILFITNRSFGLRSKQILFILLIIVIHEQSFGQTGRAIPELANLDSVIIQFMQKWDIREGTAAIVHKERLVYARAFGKDSLLQETQPSDLFRIASLSKPITAIAIMKLVEEGKINLDDQVFGTNGILNDLIYMSICDERILDITVRHLLQHTAGWDRTQSDEGDPMFNTIHIAEAMRTPIPADKITIIRYMLGRKLDFSPGTAFAYSNLGYNILGRIIEKESGYSYEEYVKKYVLYPLGIFDMQLAKNAHFNSIPNNNLSATKNIKKGHCIAACPGINLEAMDANGGWMATATDLAKLLVATDGSHTFPDLLTKESIAEMTKPSKENPSYGLGWFVNTRGNYWHTGSLTGTSAFMARLKNGMIGVVIFSDRVDSGKFFSEMDRLLWSGVKEITHWPSHDLFNAEKIAIQETEDQDFLLNKALPH